MTSVWLGLGATTPLRPGPPHSARPAHSGAAAAGMEDVGGPSRTTGPRK
jgi:hypothetical protein